jgi:mono/diheme cytochrome c family protein
MSNDAGHDYRLKNLFGWDLKGREGIYGPGAMAKGYAVSRSLLGGRETQEDLVLLLTKGDREIPSYGDVLTPPQIEAVAAFVIGVRDGALPHPDQIFTIKPPAQGHYALLPGGDAARGKAHIKERCSSCHGDDGTKVLFDDGAYSLGSHARQKAYEDWHKILNGQPGSPMGRQVRGSTGKEMAQELLDILAALCDRGAFPPGKATAKDVETGDGRCGSYLK